MGNLIQISPTDQSANLAHLDQLKTYRQAAVSLGVGYHVIQRAARRGLIKTYTLGTSRRYVKLRDIFAALESSTPR